MAKACELIEGLSATQVIADRAYDAHQLHDIILDQGGEPVIPPRRHRKHQHAYDKIAYQNRWGIEGFFAKLKQWRRIATRYDTNSPQASSASSNSPASCSGSND